MRKNINYLLYFIILYSQTYIESSEFRKLFFSNSVHHIILIIKCLNQIISENKTFHLRLCTFTLHKCQEKNVEPEPGFELGPPDL